MHHQIILENHIQITDIITSLAAFIAAITAAYGVNEWKRQLKGKTNYRVAKRYLKATLKLRDAIKFVRNPFIVNEEIKVALKECGHDEQDHNNSDIKKDVYSIRWKKIIEAWTELETELLEAEVLWGSEAIDAQKPLDISVRKLRGAMTVFLRDGSLKTETTDLIYDAGEEDTFSKEIFNNIKKIKDYLKPHLK